MKTNDIFISYSSKDLSKVKKIANCLAKHNFDIFWDRSILTGEDFTDVIQEQLETSRCIVVLWSLNSRTSR